MIKAMTIPSGISCAAVVAWLTSAEIPFHLMVSSTAAMRVHATARPPNVSSSFSTRIRTRLQVSVHEH